MNPFHKVLVANRGEIAVRVIRALREMGIKSVAVYSEADRPSLHVRLADEAVCIGPAPAAQSYLNQEAILSAAKITGAGAVHPGYGFLSENGAFAQACKEWGAVFIGPSAEAIHKLGNKSRAKALAEQLGIPLVPGTAGCLPPEALSSEDSLRREAERIGLPIMIKAAAGGGGKGLRVVRDPKNLLHEIAAAEREAHAAFGDGSLFLEKLIERPRHIEIQIAADLLGNSVAFPERDCSIQRRHQKLIEESPSPAITPKQRQSLADCALRLVRAAGYTNVGTVEFLVDPDGRFYFLEVNSRLQVEHPVTESATGVDLVKEQIRLAMGERLGLSQARAMEIRNHAIEHRINAEDPSRQFAPCPGEVTSFLPPGGPGVRLDTFVYPGYTVPSYYDSLIAKLIAYGPDRPQALSRARRALKEMTLSGIATTVPFHQSVLEDAGFQAGEFDTRFIEQMNHEKSDH